MFHILAQPSPLRKPSLSSLSLAQSMAYFIFVIAWLILVTPTAPAHYNVTLKRAEATSGVGHHRNTTESGTP